MLAEPPVLTDTGIELPGLASITTVGAGSPIVETIEVRGRAPAKGVAEPGFTAFWSRWPARS